MKKIIALLLVVMMAVGVLVSCGNGEDTTTTAAPTTAPTTDTTKAAQTTVAPTTEPTTTTAPTATTAPPVVTPDGITPDSVVWRSATRIMDETGMLCPWGSDGRYAMTTFVEVNEGDNIKLDSDVFSFIIYGYADAEGTYEKNGYIDAAPEDPNSNWGNDYTFTSDAKYGNGKSVTFPLYIRLVVKEKAKGAENVPADMKDSFEFNITAENAHLKADGFNTAKLSWLTQSGLNDTTGEFSYYKSKSRLALDTYIKVNPGDKITLNNDDYVFILYSYYDDTGLYVKDSWMDVDPDSDSNWGNTYTFSEASKTGNGAGLLYPSYVKIVVKPKTDASAEVPESVRNDFVFEIATAQD